MCSQVRNEDLEEWRAIKTAPGYEVSSHGRVRSLDRVVQTKRGLYHLKGKMLSLGEHPYPKVPLRLKSGKRTLRCVHSLVIEAFVGKRPKGKECAHRDGNSRNNHRRNLRYATPKQNAADKIRHGTHRIGERHPGAVLTAQAVSEIRKRLKRKETQRTIAEKFGVNRTTIQAIANGRSWRRR